MVTELGKYLEEIGGGVKQIKADRFKTEPIRFDFDEEGVEKFNAIYQHLKSLNLRKLVRGTSGTILKSCKQNNYGAWDVNVHSTGATITVRVEGFTYAYNIGHISKDVGGLRGHQAFRLFKDKCFEHGIDLDKYKIDNGAEVKKTIPSPLIKMNQYMTIDDEPLDSCYHIDFHNSYPAGLCNTHPEFRPVIEPIYLNRKVKPENKAILNYSIGFMQSLNPLVKGAWAHLSKDAITDNNKRITELSEQLEKSGRKILGYNTDGIWYQGEIYHAFGEGSALGEWENDHCNCLFRSKSDGAYEFIEDGKYHPVVRGATRLDSIMDRENWKWGDIYTASEFTILYRWDDEVGYVKEEIEL